MLLKLDKCYQNCFLKIINLPKKKRNLSDGTLCNVAGWGANDKGKYPEKLQEVNVTIISNAKCNRLHLYVHLVKDTICVGDLNGKKRCLCGTFWWATDLQKKMRLKD